MLLTYQTVCQDALRRAAVKGLQFLMGFVISSRQIKTDPDKLNMMVNWLVPTDRKQLQHFLGFACFCHIFITTARSLLLCTLSPICNHLLLVPWGWGYILHTPGQGLLLTLLPSQIKELVVDFAVASLLLLLLRLSIHHTQRAGESWLSSTGCKQLLKYYEFDLWYTQRKCRHLISMANKLQCENN